MKQILLTAVLLLVSLNTNASGPYDGIWSSDDYPNTFHTLVENSGTLVAIELNINPDAGPAIEGWFGVLTGSRTGQTGVVSVSFAKDVLGDNGQLVAGVMKYTIRVEFTSPTTASTYLVGCQVLQPVFRPCVNGTTGLPSVLPRPYGNMTKVF